MKNKSVNNENTPRTKENKKNEKANVEKNEHIMKIITEVRFLIGVKHSLRKFMSQISKETM